MKRFPPPPPIKLGSMPHPALMGLGLIGWLVLLAVLVSTIFGGSK